VRIALVILAAALGAACLRGTASADLRDECWQDMPTFQLSGQLCPKVPRGIGR
jgi:hypothetical protein